MQALEDDWRAADGLSIVRSRDINLGRIHNWLSEVIEFHNRHAVENTFDLPCEAYKWGDLDTNQMEEDPHLMVHRVY